MRKIGRGGEVLFFMGILATRSATSHLSGLPAYTHEGFGLKPRNESKFFIFVFTTELLHIFAFPDSTDI